MAEPTPSEPPSGLRRQVSRQQLAVIAGLGVVLFLVFLLVVRPALTGGGGGGGNKAIQAPSPGTSVVPTTTTIPPGGAPAESFELFGTKNPFQPLVGPAGTASAPGGATTGTTVAGGTGATTATTVPSVPSGAAGGAATEPRRSQRVALLNVYQSGGRTVADVRVNDTVFTKLAPGDVFDTNFKVVSLQGSCGTFLFGDERFELCKGQEILK